MFHPVLPIACGVLLAAPTLAQQRVDPSRLHPITAPVRNAGTVDVTTGRWKRPGAQKAFLPLVYDNTCTWQTQGYYADFDWCEEMFDEGRIPSPSSPNAPAGAQAAQGIAEIEVSYCTLTGPLQAMGGYDMDLAFWDKLGGDCLGFLAPAPPPVSSTATAYLPLAGLGLPGSTALGFQACWLVTLDVSNAGIVLASDGEGSYDGSGADDKFVWMQRQNTTQGALHTLGMSDGFFISGEPASGGFGACTYSIPCGTDAIFGGPCGTGLDTYDMYWLNVDGVAVGSSSFIPGCDAGLGVGGTGTNCYSFGGYPQQPLASMHLRLRGATPIECGQSFCAQSKATSVVGCTASLGVTDCTLATGSWSATGIPRDAGAGVGTSLGIFVYTHGAGSGMSTFAAATPFGTLCLSGFERSAPACAPALLANAQPGVCNAGPMAIEVDCNGAALGVAVGEDVNVQLWYRDPTAANPGNANLSNAVFYTVQ